MSLWFAYASHVITRVQLIILSVPIVRGLATVLSVPIVLSVPNVLVYQSLLDKCYNWMFFFPSSEWSSPYYRLVRILCSAHFIYFILIFFTCFFLDSFDNADHTATAATESYSVTVQYLRTNQHTKRHTCR